MRTKVLLTVVATCLAVAALPRTVAQSLTDGLVAYYPFNGNANDASGYGRNGVVVGATLTNDRFGRDRGCFSFTEVGHRIEVPASMHPQGNPEVTYSCWLTWPDVVAHRPQFIVNIGTTDGGWFVDGTRSGIGFDIYGEPGLVPTLMSWTAQNASAVFVDVSEVPPAQWRHLVVVKEPHSVKFYIDGQLFGQESLAVEQNVTSSNLLVGCSLPSVEQFFGSLDDLRIYDRVLSENEVGELYNLERPKLTDGLVAYYPFNGNANDATAYNNNPTENTAALSTNRFGIHSAAFRFTGSTEIRYDDAPQLALGTLPFSVFAWIQFSDLPGFSGILSKMMSDANPSSGFQLGISRNTLEAQIGSPPAVIVHGNTPLSDNTWHSVGLVVDRSSGTASLFVDGKLEGWVIDSKLLQDVSCPDPLLIGVERNHFIYFAGSIDDVRIYNRALSGQEVAEMYEYETSPGIDITRAVKLTQYGMTVGVVYQLQQSTNLTDWLDVGDPFTATEPLVTSYVDVADWNTFWRLKQVSP
jgi:hypothetical protein